MYPQMNFQTLDSERMYLLWVLSRTIPSKYKDQVLERLKVLSMLDNLHGSTTSSTKGLLELLQDLQSIQEAR